jgi:SAM-dependent methyltransferase
VEALGLGPGRTVVDVGAGTGKLTRLLVTTRAAVVAVEPVAAMRAFLPPEVRAVDAAAEALPFARGFADAITLAQAIHWLRPVRALSELRRVLSPDGRLAVVTNRRDDADPLTAAFSALLERARGHAALEERPPADVVAGGALAVEDVRQFAFVHELPPADLRTLAASETSIALLDDGARAAALAEFDRLADPAEGPVRLRYVTEVVVARPLG